MAIAIKSIPVLRDKVAKAFTATVTVNTGKKSTVDFPSKPMLHQKF